MEEGDTFVMPAWIAHQLRQCHVAVSDVCSKLESQVERNPELPPAYREIVRRGYVALAEIDRFAKMGPPVFDAPTIVEG
jgi:hypothetical protein